MLTGNNCKNIAAIARNPELLLYFPKGPSGVCYSLYITSTWVALLVRLEGIQTWSPPEP